MYIRAELTLLRSLAMALCACSSVSLCACRPTWADVENRPAHQIKWPGAGGGFGVWGSGGEFLYATSVQPEVLEVWRWVGGTVKKHAEWPWRGGGLAWMNDDRCVLIASPDEYDDSPLLIRSSAADKG